MNKSFYKNYDGSLMRGHRFENVGGQNPKYIDNDYWVVTAGTPTFCTAILPNLSVKTGRVEYANSHEPQNGIQRESFEYFCMTMLESWKESNDKINDFSANKVQLYAYRYCVPTPIDSGRRLSRETLMQARDALMNQPVSSSHIDPETRIVIDDFIQIPDWIRL